MSTNVPAASRTPSATTEQFLLLCVDAEPWPRFVQVKLTPHSDDSTFLREMREAYQRLCSSRVFDFSDDTPRLVKDAVKAFYSFSDSIRKSFARLLEFLHLRWFVLSVGDSIFSIPSTANFVMFGLLPVKEEVCPEVLESPSLPPEKEVKVHLNYHYAPCPYDDMKMTRRIRYLHSFLAPGTHLMYFWQRRTPKKLRERMQEGPNPLAEPAVVGWGVHIGRGPNWRAYIVLAELLLVPSLLFGVLYGLLARDLSGGFAVAQYAVAVMTMLNSLIMAKLMQKPG